MNLYGQQWTRRELEARLGRLEQVAGVQRFQYTEGPERDVEQIRVRTGGGLEYHVVPARGLDISLAAFGGAPLSWQSPNGEMHPAFYNPRGSEWLRTAAGGLLMTCGLTQVGSAGEDQGEELGLHGRIHHIPARHVVGEGRWADDSYEMRVSGVLEEVSIFGHRLRLTREIRSRLGINRIVIHDTVENTGFEPAPHMILYHFNFGFPLMSESTRVELPSRRVTPREADTPLQDLDRWQAPQPGFQERVYYHEDLLARDGWTEAALYNPQFPTAGGQTIALSVRLRWTVNTLPRLVQWRMPGAGEYVLGLEPANCWVGGRAAERELGTLLTLQPGEQRVYQLLLEVEALQEDGR